jgi:hypothetical protein
MKKLILTFALAIAAPAAFADDESDIVSGCAMSNAEWGVEMIQLCVTENKTARAEVQAYPQEYQGLVQRCSRRKEMGWGMVKRCVDDDIAAKPVLEAYAKEHGPLLAQCQEEFQGRELTRIKLCVEMALAANGAEKNK